MKLLIRPPQDAEFEEIYQVYRDAFDRLKGVIDPPSSAEQQTPASLRKATGHSDILVALLQDRIVGCVFYRTEEDSIYLYRLAVLPSEGGRGIATALVRGVEGVATVNGADRVALNVRLNLPRNQALFARLGYAEVSRHAHDGYDHDTFMRMEKPIGAGEVSVRSQ